MLLIYTKDLLKLNQDCTLTYYNSKTILKLLNIYFPNTKANKNVYIEKIRDSRVVDGIYDCNRKIKDVSKVKRSKNLVKFKNSK